MTLSLALEKFFADRATYCKGVTIQNYRVWLSVFVEYMESVRHCPASRIDFASVTLDDIKAYNVHLRERYAYGSHPNNPASPRRISKTSVRTYMVAVRALYTFLWQDGHIGKNLMQGYRMIRKEKHGQEVLTNDEVKKVDGCLDLGDGVGLRNWLVVHLMLDAGLRRSEVVGLRCGDIDMDKGIIFIRGGKGDKNRMVLLPSCIRGRLPRYQPNRNDPDGALFLCRGGRPITLETIKDMFGRLKKAAGIPRLHPHLLRHTFATSFIYYGGRSYDLMFWLGHSSLNTTQIYVDLSAACKLLRLDIYKIDDVFLQK